MAYPSAIKIGIASEDDPFEYSDRIDAILFGETPGRVVVSLPPRAEEEGAWSLLSASAEAMGLRVAKIGYFGEPGDGLTVAIDGNVKIQVGRDGLKGVFDGAIEKHLAH
jgi:hypothetical protein